MEGPQHVEARLSYGTIVGVEEQGVLSFRGVPYASAQRFRPPEPIRRLPVDKLTCFTDGPACPQPPLIVNPSHYLSASGAWSLARGVWRLAFPVPQLDSSVFSEACHNLQIYAPSSSSGMLPVLVFIHGGAWFLGSNRDMLLQHERGCKLAAAQKVVVVHVNYRLGCLGFISVPGGPSNLGILDVISALEFIHREIHAFRGDASRVTVAGESAGAMLIGALLHTRRTVGLFSRCIMMSGGLHNIMSMEDHCKLSQAFTMSVPDFLGVAVETLLDVECGLIGDTSRWGATPYMPVFDDLISTELCHPSLDILIGVNDDEFSLFWPQTRVFPDVSRHLLTEGLRPMVPDLKSYEIDQLLSLFPPGTPGYVKSTRVMSALIWEASSVLSSEVLDGCGHRVCTYRNFLSKAHVGELPYIFGTWNRNLYTRWMAGLPLRPSQEDLKHAHAHEELWMGLVGGFIRCGCSGLPLSEKPPHALYLHPGEVRAGPMASAFVASIADMIKRRAIRPNGLAIPKSRL